MRTLIRAVAALAALTPALSAPAYADAGGGYISHVFTILDDGTVAFNQSGVRSNVPACGQNLPLRWVINPNTTFGQVELSVLLSAYALHKQVGIVGTGDCGVHGDTETVRYIDVLD